MVHGDQAKEVVVRLGDGLPRPVPVDRADLKLLVVPAELHSYYLAVTPDAMNGGAPPRHPPPHALMSLIVTKRRPKAKRCRSQFI